MGVVPENESTRSESPPKPLEMPYGGSPILQGPTTGALDHRQQRVLARRDMAMAQRALRGEISGEEALSTIAWSGGLPIITDTSMVFLASTEAPELSVVLGGEHHALKRQGNLQIVELPVVQHNVSYQFLADGQTFADPWARNFNYDQRDELSLTRASGSHFQRWPNLYGAGAAPREVQVWLPPGPVTHQVYVHDGQNLFNPRSMHGGWNLQHKLGPGTMAIGIDNSRRRFEDLTLTPDKVGDQVMGGEGDCYFNFVQTVVRAHVEKTYGAAGKVGIMGSSLGGLASLEIASRFPDAFDFVGSMSGTVGWGAELGHETVQDRLLKSTPRALIYLDSGGRPGRDNYSETKALAEALGDAGLSWNEQLFHWYEPGAPHAETAWSDRLFRPLQIFESL